jgi:hypothetical protein
MSGSRPLRQPEDLRQEILAFLSGLSSPELMAEEGWVMQLVRSDDTHPTRAPSQPLEVRSHDSHFPAKQGRAERDVSEARWRLEVEFGKLLLEVWSGSRSLVRRIEACERDGSHMRLRARKPGGAEPVMLEIRETGDRQDKRSCTNSSSPDDSATDADDAAARRARDRVTFEHELLAMLGREFTGWRFEQISHRPDREYCLSGLYTRGSARRGRESWAFIALGDHEALYAAEDALAYGLIWLDWLRERGAAAREAGVVTGLKLFLPPHAVMVAAHRAAYLDPRASGIEIFEWRQHQASPRLIDLRDYGNVQTRLTPRWRGVRIRERLRPLIRDLVQGLPAGLADRVSAVPDALGDTLSLRVFGLSVARIEGGELPRVWFGLEGERRELRPEDRSEFSEFLAGVLRLRRPRGPDRAHPYYRLQPERWLESLLVDEISRLDPAFRPEHVYPQVPAFTGPATPSLSRGVIDILGLTQDPLSGIHRLAVVELKLDEDPNLPMQGLDYWLRVKWLEERDQFREHGYFAGLPPSQSPPVIYLVSPAFRFHSTTERILRYFQPAITVVKVGLNQRWREGIKVLFRRTLVQGRAIEERIPEGASSDGSSERAGGFSFRRGRQGSDSR